MVSKNSLLLLLNLLAGSRRFRDQAPSEWDYKNTNEWIESYPSCGGSQQSPIDLQDTNTIGSLETQLYFENYNVSFIKELVMENNGHSAEIALPETVNGERPIISGGLLKDRYEAHSVHWHWGSFLKKGSEHTINGQQYNAEIHIVHKNIKYETVDEATQNPDGIAVLGIFIKVSNNPLKTYSGLNEVFNKLTQIKPYEANTTVTNLALHNFLGNINTKKFYGYQGSLTTPPCSEAVSWHVLSEPLQISRRQLYKMFTLRQKNGKYLVNNYRPLQSLNGRKIYSLA